MPAFMPIFRPFLQRVRVIAALIMAACAVLSSSVGLAAEPSAAPRLILLGTAGGPTPKPNRSAPAVALVVNGATYIFDAGNGVASQVIKAKLKLASIRSLFLTHHHSDHNADWGNLQLLAWAADLSTPIMSYGPPDLEQMKKSFLKLNAEDIRIRVADEGRLPLKNFMKVKNIKNPGLVMQDDNIKVTTAIVDHPPIFALAYRIELKDAEGNPRAIVISGDTHQSENLIKLAQGADVLIHEVMHAPSLEKLIATEPNAKTLMAHLVASHTDTEHVGKVAAKAGVKTLVLTHFVPGGYPFLTDEEWSIDVRKDFSGPIIVGKDLMEIPL